MGLRKWKQLQVAQILRSRLVLVPKFPPKALKPSLALLGKGFAAALGVEVG